MNYFVVGLLIAGAFAAGLLVGSMLPETQKYPPQVKTIIIRSQDPKAFVDQCQRMAKTTEELASCIWDTPIPEPTIEYH